MYTAENFVKTTKYLQRKNVFQISFKSYTFHNFKLNDRNYLSQILLEQNEHNVFGIVQCAPPPPPPSSWSNLVEWVNPPTVF